MPGQESCQLRVPYTLVHITMPKKLWASKDQQDWHYAQLPDFCITQEAKTTPSFFFKIYKEFHAQWPVPSPIAEERGTGTDNQGQSQ